MFCVKVSYTKSMKNISIIIAILFLFVTSVDIVNAEEKKMFETSVASISEIRDMNITQFDIKVENIIQSNAITYWKVRSYCDKNMSLHINTSDLDNCGKAVRLDSLTNNSFTLLFDNKNTQIKNFSIKLKAYDQNGKWIHTEQESFGWK